MKWCAKVRKINTLNKTLKQNNYIIRGYSICYRGVILLLWGFMLHILCTTSIYSGSSGSKSSGCSGVLADGEIVSENEGRPSAMVAAVCSRR